MNPVNPTMSDMMQRDPAEQQQKVTAHAVVPTNAPSPDSMRVLTPEEAAQISNTTEAKPIDIRAEEQAKLEEKYAKAMQEPVDQMKDLMMGAIQAEEDRFQRLDNTLSDPEAKRELYKGTVQDVDKQSAVVHYDNRTDDTPKQEQSKSVSRERIQQEEVDYDDFLPSYDDDDVEEPEAEEIKKDDPAANRPTPNTSEEEYAKYIKGLEVTRYEEPEDYSIIQVTKDRKAMVANTSSKRLGSTKSMQDESFMNAINKFKKDNFPTVSVPLVNSGFSVEIVGTGAVDLTLLYSSVDANVSSADYEIAKMRTVMRNVVATHPHVGKNDLRNMIHFADYQLMAYAHIAATLKDLETIQTCPECGNDYHIVCNSTDIIMNMPELKERMLQIQSSDRISDYSLMVTDKEISTDDGFEICLGHPSYADYIQYLTELKSLNESMEAVEMNMLSKIADSLHYVRSITMPNGVHTSNLFQRFQAIRMLTDADLNLVQNEIRKMADKTIVPQFGIKKITCPHCGKVNTNITYNTLDELLFFHTMVTRLLSQTESTSSNG